MEVGGDSGEQARVLFGVASVIRASDCTIDQIGPIRQSTLQMRRCLHDSTTCPSRPGVWSVERIACQRSSLLNIAAEPSNGMSRNVLTAAPKEPAQNMEYFLPGCWWSVVVARLGNNKTWPLGQVTRTRGSRRIILSAAASGNMI